MNQEQLLETYGTTNLRFKSYYKYAFTFEGVAENCAVVSVTVGGDRNDIYKYDVKANRDVSFRSLIEYWGFGDSTDITIYIECGPNREREDIYPTKVTP